MSDDIVVGRGRLFASDQLLWLVDLGLTPVPPPGKGNGLLVVTQPGAALLFTGIHTGWVDVEVETRRSPPAEPAPDEGWEEIVDVSLVAPTGQVRITSFAAFDPEPLPVLTAAGAGTYRVRVHAAGRGINVDGTATEPVERYRLVTWPGPVAPDHVHRSA